MKNEEFEIWKERYLFGMYVAQKFLKLEKIEVYYNDRGVVVHWDEQKEDAYKKWAEVIHITGVPSMDEIDDIMFKRLESYVRQKGFDGVNYIISITECGKIEVFVSIYRLEENVPSLDSEEVIE